MITDNTVTPIFHDCNLDFKISEYLDTPNDPRSEARVSVDIGSLVRIVGLQTSHDRAGNLIVRPPYTLAIQGGQRIPGPAIWFLNQQLKLRFDRAVEAALAEYHAGVR